MSQSVIASLFDQQTERFWTYMAIASPADECSGWYSQAAGARLLHIGSGSSRFEEAVGLDEINAFLSDLAAERQPQAAMGWFRDAFAKVSELAEGCAPEFRAFIATRQRPEFQPCTGQPS